MSRRIELSVVFETTHPEPEKLRKLLDRELRLVLGKSAVESVELRLAPPEVER